MKTCSKCRLDKSESDFFVKEKKSGRLHTQCKQCYKQHRKTYYTEHYNRYKDHYLQRAKQQREKIRQTFRSNMLEYLSDKSCAICGENDIRVLEFDHLNPADKRFGISQAVRLGYNWADVLSEVAKCRILCANCHKKHTATQFGWYKS